MAISRRRLRCHYCNSQARDNVSTVVRTYHCLVCDTVNYFDERGQIDDPPVEAIAAVSTRSFQYVQSRSPSPAMQPADENLFCDTCLRNQATVLRILTEYLPEEDDPEYEKYEAAYDDYKLELEQRYPQLCSDCEPRVQAQIANTGYAAKADHLRRIMEKSQQRRAIIQTPRQIWLLRLIALAKWTYTISIVLGLLWHGLGLIMAPNNGYTFDDTFSLSECLRQAASFSTLSLEESCVLSDSVLRVQEYAVLTDLLTMWWNPMLPIKVNSLTGRISGLTFLWIVRVAVFLLRVASVYYWAETSVTFETIDNFRITHLTMLLALVLSYITTTKSARIVYLTPSSFHHASRPNTPTSAEKRSQSTYRPAHPQANTFDSMAQAFTTSFQDGTAVPPSPTLSVASDATYNTEATTPYTHRRSAFSPDEMDWTPTQQRRFAAYQPDIYVDNPWSKRHAAPLSPSPPPQSAEPHSLFSRPDPNPFRHKVPAVPKPPAHVRANPWKPGVWNPPNKATTTNFFQQARSEAGGSGSGEAMGLEGVGVPRNVKRDAELFASPKFKYDNYGPVKDTGLEETFNGLFSK